MSIRHLRPAIPSSLLRGLLMLAALASLAEGATQTINGDPLQISVDDSSNVTVLRSEVDTVGSPATFDRQYFSVYSPFLVLTPHINGVVGPPAVWSGNSDLNTFTAVSNSISVDGFSTTTVDTADNGSVSIQQTIAYVNGTQQYQHTFVVTNESSSVTYSNVALRYGGDTFFANADQAIGYWDPTLGFVYCTDPNVSGLMGMYGGASSPATNYYEDAYGNVWTALENPANPLPNTVNGTFIDNGMGLEWEEGTLVPGASFTVVVIEQWTAAGAVQVLPPPSQNIGLTTPVMMTFSIQNLESVDDTFALSLSATSGLNATSQTTVAVAANSTATVQVTVSAASLTGGAETVTLTATSQTTPSVTNQGTAALTTTVAVGSVVVAAVSSPQFFTVGSSMQVPFTIQNLETFPASDTFALSAVASGGFLVGTLAPVTLAINASTTVNVPVTVLSSAPATGVIQLIATSTSTASITGRAGTALAATGVAVASPPVQLAGVGVTLNIPFTVTNYQSTSASFSFSVTAPSGMMASTPASIIIAANGVATVIVQVTITTLVAGAQNAVTLTALSGNFRSQATTQLVTTQPVSLPSIPLSPGSQTVYNSISPSTPEGVANLLAVMAPETAQTAQAFAWDSSSQAYVQLPAQPSGGGLQPSSGVFLATRHSLALDFSGTPTASPFYLNLNPGWNFVGIPLLIDGTGTLVTSHAFPADFTLFDAGSAEIGDAFTFTNDLGTVGSGTLASANPYFYNGSSYAQVATLSAGLGYWIKNNTLSNLTLVRNQTGTITTLSRLGKAPTAGALPATTASAQTGVLIDRGSPPPPPGSSSASDGGSGHGCGLGTGAAFLTGLSLMLFARRLRRSPGALER